mgnify:CR=1 FL=1
MADALMAYPELRYPYERKAIHSEGDATVLYQGKTIRLTDVGEGDGLLIKPEDLTRINGFTVKPEGACLDDLCIPLTNTILVQAQGQQWVDLQAFAELLEQPFVCDTQNKVWSFAEIPAKRQSTLQDAMVPDFEIADRQGRKVNRADLKGRKALIVTWSSW